ncbi:MAG: tetratricopeptide repeat protein, partial [Candidatus Eisenbacteria bacterium]|nr:tetratricopeptide repeat protein [Candidatus Eisenbacteria bacterium]
RSELEYAQKLIKDGLYDVARGELARFTGRDTPAGVRQRAFMLLGDVETASSNHDKAKRFYESAYEADPGGGDGCAALAKVGAASFLLEDYRGAASAFQKLPELFPDCALVRGAMFDLGRAHFELGDYEEAVRQFERTRSACGIDEENPELLLWLGRAQFKLDPSRGLETFQSILRSHAGTPAAFGASLELAAELDRRGNSEAAVAVLERALKYKNVDRASRAVGLLRHGALLSSGGKHREAGRAFSECFELSADSSLCERCNLRAQESFLSAALHSEADEMAQKLLSGSYSDRAKEASLLTRAASAKARGDLDGSLVFLERLRRAAAPDSLYCLARIEEAETREALSDYGGAESSYLLAMKHSCPESLRERVLLGLADLYGESMADPERASLYRWLVVRLHPGSEAAGAAAHELAEAAEKRGDFAEAARLFAGVAGDFPLSDQADDWRRRAEALQRLFPPSVRASDIGKLTGALSSAASGELQGDRALQEAARVLGSEFREYDEAASLLEQALTSAPVERKHLVLMALGETRILQAERAEYLGEKDKATQYRSEGLRSFRDLVSQYSNSSLADDARLELVKAELERVESPDKERRAPALYSDFLREYPETDRLDEALFRRAVALEALSEHPEDEQAGDALSDFDRIVREFPRSRFVAETRLRKARMLCRKGETAACERELEVVVEQFPSAAAAAEAAYELGELNLAKRATDKAVRLYTVAFEKAGTRSLRERALARRGDSHLVAGDLAGAVDEYEYVLARDPRGPFADDLLAKVAQAYLGRGMLAEASAPLKRLGREFPQSALLPGLLMRKAQAEERAGDFAAAKSTYDEIGRKFPQAGSDTTFVMGLGRASLKSGDFALGLKAFERLLKMDTSPELKREAGRGAVLALARMGEESKLRKRLEWYVKTFPEDESVANEVALERGLGLYRSGRYEEAYSALSSVESNLPASGRMNALVTMGLSKLKVGDYAAAAGAFRAAVEAGRGAPTDSSLAYTARFKLGSSLFAMSAFREASAAYVEAAEFCADSSQCCEAWYNGGLCLERAQDWEASAELYLRVAGGCAGKLGKDAAFKAGYCRLNAGENREAVALLVRALAVSDESEKPEVQYWIGEAYAAAGDMDRAAAEFLKVPYLYGESTLWAVTARYKAGQAFEAAGNKDAAVKQYRAIIQREGEQSEWGSMARERLLLLSK